MGRQSKQKQDENIAKTKFKLVVGWRGWKRWEVDLFKGLVIEY